MPLIEEGEFEFDAGPSSSSHLQAPSPSAARTHSPIPDANLPTDFGDLLSGLGADDLDDFGDIDDEDIRNDKSFEEAHPHQSAGFDDGFGGTSIDPAEIPKTVGFATASGNKLRSPSREAVAKANKLWNGQEMAENQFEEENKPAKKPRLSDPSEDELISHEHEHEHEHDDGDAIDFPMDFVGFKTGNSKIVAPPKAESLQRASKMFSEIDQAMTTEDEPPSSSIPTSSFQPAAFQTPTISRNRNTGFSSANRGKPIAQPSLQAMQRAAKIFAEVDEKTEIHPSSSTPQSSSQPVGAGFALASGSNAPRLSQDAMRRAMNVLNGGQSDNSTPSKAPLGSTTSFHTASSRNTMVFIPPPTAAFDESSENGNPSSTSAFTSASGKPAACLDKASRAAVAHLFSDLDTNMATLNRSRPQTPQPPSRAISTPFIRPRPAQGLAQPSTPLRTPTSHPASLAKRPIQIKTPSGPMRRIGLGSTPGQRQVKKAFSTPFKTGTATSYLSQVSVQDPGPSKQREVIHYHSVFDLEPPTGRQNYKAAFLHPQYYSKEDLKDLDIPDDIFAINLETAPDYRFLAEDESYVGPVEALNTLQADGAAFAKANWVENHWSQILWKLAGQVQAKPALFAEKWNWDEVIRQLKYRYEREFGCAERSIIKRIQEHDSPASLPMILIVSAIYPAPVEDKAKPKYALELTDGWYRIKLQIDESLNRAVSKGKIAIGRKLAISGAKLESGNDGKDVLEAYVDSTLTISGNSTCLARWDVKLGKQPQPFIASLSSLSVDGGIICLMDIVIEKIFPIAYMGKGEAPWNEEEEQTRQDEWMNRFEGEKTRLADKMRKELERMEDLASMLAQSAETEENERVSPEPPESLENDYERLLEAKDVTGCLRSMTNHQIIHLAGYANMRIQQEMQEKQFEMEGELATICPKREARDFRIIRFVDAQMGIREPFRVGMLNVWDVKALGEGVLEEGKRYLISNLVPGKTGDWSIKRNRSDKAEVYLHTRRDTRWQPVEE